MYLGKYPEKFLPNAGVCYIEEEADWEYTYNDFVALCWGNKEKAAALFDYCLGHDPIHVLREEIYNNSVFGSHYHSAPRCERCGSDAYNGIACWDHLAEWEQQCAAPIEQRETAAHANDACAACGRSLAGKGHWGCVMCQQDFCKQHAYMCRDCLSAEREFVFCFSCWSIHQQSTTHTYLD